MIKTLNELGVEENYLDIIKTIVEKPITSLIVTGRIRKAFPLRSERNRDSCLYYFSSL